MNKKGLWGLISLLVSASLVSAQEADVESRFEDADAVIIRDVHEFLVESPTDATYKVYRKIRVNNERGKEYGQVLINESRFAKCVSVEGRIKDLEGELLRELEEDEIFETTRSMGYTLYDDDKYQFVELGWSRFPYTVEYSYELEFNTLLSWPGWFPQDDVPVMKSIYRLVIDRDKIGYKTHAVGIEVEPEIHASGNRTILSWELENIEPAIDENRMPPEDRIQMKMLFAPDEFEVEKSRGSFSDWSSLGVWYAGLTSDRYLFHDDAKKKVRKVVVDVDEDLEKVRKLYAFLQKHTRYVAIQLGIGRWQPYGCSSVYDNQYGDCKDLSTLMISILREAGIEAYPALIRTRDLGPLITEFPSNQFNHVITVVPMGEDTVWLECTSDIVGAGELPHADEGCDVLVISEEGGRIVRTPKSVAENNHWTSKVQGKLIADGSLAMSGVVVASGNQGVWLRGELHNLKPTERKRFVTRRVARFVPKLDLTSYDIGNLSPHSGEPVSVQFSGTVEGFGVKSRDRLFFNPNLIHRETAGDIPRETERHFPIYYNYAFVEEDSTVISVPNGYVLEAAPEPLDIQTSFGSFATTQKFENGVLRHYRKLRIDQNEIPASLYEEYLTFIKAVVNSDKSNFVLVR